MLIKQKGDLLRFRCPGCNTIHAVRSSSDGRPNWSWNGSLDKPTLSPSVLVSYDGSDAGLNGAPPAICHSFVKDGRIQFLNDCTHSLAGHTVDMPEFNKQPETDE